MSKPARDIPPTVRQLQTEAADPDRSVFVSANAGSGKTHVLVQRVINLLLRGCDPAKILCITFTKAAAANMSNRVFGTLAEWATLDDTALDQAIAQSQGKPPDAVQRTRARCLFAAALETPGGLKVQTIHAFCTRLLHQFPFEADVAARFTVLDDGAARRLLENITMDVLLAATAEPDGVLARALDAAIAAAADTTFKEVIGEAIFKRDAVEGWIARAGGVEPALAELSTQLGIAPGETLEAIENEYFTGALIARSEWPLLMEILSSGSDSDRKHVMALKTAQSAAGRDSIEAYLDVFCTGERTARARIVTKKIAEAHPDLAERLIQEQQRLCGLLAKERAAQARDRTAALVRIAHEIMARYRTEKDRRALLDYEDQIDKTLALFRKASAAWVLYKLDDGIDHVLVDEAQDTSSKQWEIIRTIVSEFVPGGSRPNTPRTVFAVGDEKQSIFSFQGASPKAFADNRGHFQHQFREVEDFFIAREFKVSFRSGPNVLGAVDTVFAREPALKGVSADNLKLLHQPLRDATPGLVEVWDLVEPAEKDDGKEAWDAPFDVVDEQSPSVVLARRIARTIQQWAAQGDKWSDTLVLVRQRGPQFEAVIRALKDARIPVAGADRLQIIEHIAVMDLLVLADALLLPDDDLALATVLRSPLFNFSEDQLFTLAWRRPASLRASLGAKVGDDPMFAAAHRALGELTVAARTHPPFTFYAHVLGAGRGRAAFLARLGHEATDALDEFLNLALDYELRETPSLQGFVAWMRTANAEVKRDMELDRNEVRVMTVHGAKGLEAKNVILADTTSKPSGPRDPRLLALEDTSRPPLVWAGAKANDAGTMSAARTRAQDAAADEYRRLLYVAMTRAIDRLVVCGTKGSNKIPDGCWYGLVREALEPESEPLATDDGAGFRYCKTMPEARKKSAPSPQEKSAPLPLWLTEKAGMETPAATPLRPSDDEDEKRGLAHGEGREVALLRGRAAHRLLQSLPDIASSHRGKAANDYLSRAGRDLTPAARDNLAKQVLAVLDDARFAPLFAPGSRAEVSIVGKVSIGKKTYTVAGQVDRLVVNGDDVLIADYKTNRPPPQRIDGAPPGYIRQLALYRAVLAQLYPGKRVRAALVWTETPDLMEVSPEAMDTALASHLTASAP